jgi:hypothetical protein
LGRSILLRAPSLQLDRVALKFPTSLQLFGITLCRRRICAPARPARVARRQPVHHALAPGPVEGAARVAAGHERGAGVEHLVLHVPRGEFRAERVPGELEELHPLGTVDLWPVCWPIGSVGRSPTVVIEVHRGERLPNCAASSRTRTAGVGDRASDIATTTPGAIIDRILIGGSRHHHVPLDRPVVGVVEPLEGVRLRRGVKEAPGRQLMGLQQAAGCALRSSRARS